MQKCYVQLFSNFSLCLYFFFGKKLFIKVGDIDQGNLF